MSSDLKIAIIGAGVAGIAAGLKLRSHGFSVSLFDKSRGIGGRVATRRACVGLVSSELHFDHGAQFFTARSKPFQKALAHTLDIGSTKLWSVDDEVRAYVGAPTMNAFLKDFSAPLDVRLHTTISEVKRTGSQWRIRFLEDAPDQLFDVVLSTAPPAQTHNLCAGSSIIREGCNRAVMTPCWALMVSFFTPFEGVKNVYRNVHQDMPWVARNSSKFGRPEGEECWVGHASADWSTKNLEEDESDVPHKLLPILGDILGVKLPEPTYVSAHRWRYAKVENPLGEAFLQDETGSLFAAGDWCIGPRVECAFESGNSAANAIIERYGN